MQLRRRWLVAGTLALVLVGAGVGIGLANPGDSTILEPRAGDGAESAEGTDGDTPLTGTDRERAEAAALEYTGGGRVTEVEVGDGGAAYGVEIRRDNGTQVEIMLDETFRVIGTEGDDD